MKDRALHWVRNFSRMATAGLDISDRSVKYMKIGAGKRTPLFSAFGETEIPEGMIVGGEIKDEGGLAAILAELGKRERACFRGTAVAVSLPEEKSFLRPLRVKNTSGGDIANAIRWEMESEIPLPADDLVFDYEIAAGEHEQGFVDAVLTAFPRAVVDSYVRVLKTAGFVPGAMELESQAIVRAILPSGASVLPQVVVDMGRTRTSFIIVSGGEIVFTATVAVGGLLLEENISRALGVDSAEALRIKKEIGLSRNASGGAVFAALVPAVGAFADELVRAIQSYQNHGAEIPGGRSAIVRILLSGGDANLFGLDTYLASVTGIPCARSDSFAALRPRIRDAIPPISRHPSLAYAAAIGLALRGSENSP